MSERDDGGPACAWCSRPAHIRQGRLMLCAVHYRISSMRSRAARDGKAVPARAVIEALIPEPLICIGCGREMNWLREDGASTQVTLQHDRSGTVRLICLACNTRHAQHPGDTYYDVGADKKRCPDCERVLPITDFAVDRSRPIGRRSYCRNCASVRYQTWRQRHAVA